MPIASRLTNTGNLVVNNTIDELTNNPITFGSFYFSATSNYLSIPSATAGSKYDFGLNDFTIELWLYGITNPGALSGYNLIFCSPQTNSYTVITYNGGIYLNFNGGNFLFTSSGLITQNVWNHIAVVRYSGVTTIYLNGVSRASKADTNNYSGAATRQIGPSGGGTAGFYMTNIRIVNGTAVYTGNFTPPTMPLTAITNTALLLNAPTIPSTDSFNDTSTNNVTLTKNGTVLSDASTPIRPNGYYNYYFNSANPDYLTTSTSTTTITTGDYTIECWAYGINTGASQQGIFTLTAASSSGSGGISVYVNTSNSISFFVNGNGSGKIQTSAAQKFLPNVWNHVALVGSGGTNTLYVNGVSVASNALTPTASNVPVNIGRQYGDNTAQTWNGYISNFRVVIGTALYTGAFTPPTTPLAAITNTKLLSCQSNKIIDNNASPFTFTISGSVAVNSNTSPFTTYVYSGTNVAVQRVTSTGTLQVTGIFDEYTIQGSGVAQRINPTGNLQVGGFFDEWTGAPVVDSSLMVWLDAGQPSSYSGSGATWTDLSGNGKNYTLSNGPTFNSGAKSTTGGTLTFTTASSQYATSASSLFNSTTYNTVTMNIWVYPTSSGNIIQIDGQAALATGYHASAIEITAAGVISFGLWTGSVVTTIATSTQSLNAWYNLVITYNGTTATAYINGVSVGSSNLTWSAPGTNTFMALMAAESTGMGTNAYTSGNLGAFMVYNRSLTVDEVTSNYNALRRRYGR